MTPRDCFGVVVRSVGLLTFLGGLYFLFSAVYVAMVPEGRPHSPPRAYAWYGAIFLASSIYLLRGAPGIVGFCYPATGPNESGGAE